MAEDAGNSARSQFESFLTDYKSADGTALYLRALESCIQDEVRTLGVDFVHVNEHDPELADMLKEDYVHVEPYLSKAVQQVASRLRAENTQEEDEDADVHFFVAFYNLDFVDTLRDLRAESVGRLVAFTARVTRTSEVRPELYLGTFKCGECETVVRGVDQQFTFTPPVVCKNPDCGNRKNWVLQKEESVFVDWQRIKVQENNDEIPAGSLPRTMEVIVRNDQVETARPGDCVVCTGYLIAVPDVSAIAGPGIRAHVKKNGQGDHQGGNGLTGLKELGVRELQYRLSFLALSIETSKNRDGMIDIRPEHYVPTEELLECDFTEEQSQDIRIMQRDPSIYTKLAQSIAPNVWGHEDIKKALLLMLVGGVQKKTMEGTLIRGDINVCIVGDPSCGKSQMLQYVSNFLPRGVFTAGKSSSAAGLTASVIKDMEGSDFCIEAGALMLADNGICCIDEFDKMDDRDKVAIHEAMEQQTISLSKAGIQATLNSRASILAAANPLGGRYDKSKPLRYNVMLPPALLSRFDLLHVMVDEPNDTIDRQIAEHMVALHMVSGTQEDLGEAAHQAPFSKEQMQAYLKYARSIRPKLTPEVSQLCVDYYVSLRAQDSLPGSRSCYRITIRQLEALIRLSEALARVHGKDHVQPAHVKEAHRLIQNSVNTIDTPDVYLEDVEGIELQESLGQENQPQRADTPGRRRSLLEEHGADDGMNVDEHIQDEQQIPMTESRGRVTVTHQKFETTKHLLVDHLRDHEEEVRSGGRAGAEIGMTQRELLVFFHDHLVQSKKHTPDEIGDQVKIAELIIGLLIKNEDVLVVVSTPKMQEGEGQKEYSYRRRMERVLGVHPNYD